MGDAIDLPTPFERALGKFEQAVGLFGQVTDRLEQLAARLNAGRLAEITPAPSLTLVEEKGDDDA
jgi:hypothetical protein